MILWVKTSGIGAIALCRLRNSAQNMAKRNYYFNAQLGDGTNNETDCVKLGRNIVDRMFASCHSSRLVHALGGNGKLWSRGWGDPSVLNYLSAKHEQRSSSKRCGSLYMADDKYMDIVWQKSHQKSFDGVNIWIGEFDSPVQDGTLPPESMSARCQLVVPSSFGHPADNISAGIPIWVHLAGTGDQFFWMRRMLSGKLAQQGIGSLILESPYYGSRKPRKQKGPKLQHVSDLLSLGNATIEETISILRYFNARGHGPLGVCGFSMGGVHAIMIAGVCNLPVALVTFLAPQCAIPVFCQGALSASCDWDALSRHSNSINWNEWSCEDEHVKGRLGRILRITDVTRLPPPPCPWATILVQAKDDAYIDARSEQVIRSSWRDYWKRFPPTYDFLSSEDYGVETRWVRGGHVTSFFNQHHSFRAALRTAMQRMVTEDVADSARYGEC
uniref:Uncharacterized protein n=1 Tax=Hanusia phi TaxID=3032 RepID=A0A7S0E2A1_9CRYP|mmetsp:Transcript_13243/g.30450  ORF Transcript_13243/g.30450 Transcript_13243/m.30450 type:complete len:443 (+) Transcript_13243:169-1497(+)